MQMPSKKRGQASFEYMLIAGVIGIMILPAAYLFYSYSQSSADQIDKAQMDKLGRDIASTAERVYYQGPPSRTELEARMPRGVTNLSIQGDWGTGTQYLLIRAKNIEGGVEVEYPYRSSINLNGSFNGSLGAVSISPGIKKITIEAYEVQGPGGQVTSFVHVNFGGRCPVSTLYDLTKDGVVNINDISFASRCAGDTVGPKNRPTKTWRSGWFDPNLTTNPSRVCMNADYDGDCDVDASDVADITSHFGESG